MKTGDLIFRLAQDLRPVEPNAVTKRLNRALIVGLAADTALLVVLYGIHSDMPERILTSMFWVRIAFPLAVIAAAMNLAARLARPGARLGLAWLASALPFAVM